jgi:hypothetical protein
MKLFTTTMMIALVLATFAVAAVPTAEARCIGISGSGPTGAERCTGVHFTVTWLDTDCIGTYDAGDPDECDGISP